jgi:tetratricopeptide (TPR) repeat protein
LNVDPRKGSEAPPPDTEYDKVPPPTPIPEREQRMIEAFDVYIDYVKDPKDDQLVVMKFFRARIYWRYNHLDRAVPLFEDIINNHLDHETAEFAVNLLIDTLNRQQRYDEMIKWVDILLEKKKFLADKEDLQENLETLKSQSLRRNAEQLEKVAKDTGNFGAYIDCGMAYLDIYNRNPEGEKSDEVLYNAGVCFEQGRSIGVAIQMFETLSRRFPKSRQTQMAIGRLGLNYGRIAWYDKAADRLEEYARRFGGEDDAYKALSDAVFYRKGIGHDDAAIKNTEFFIKQYGKQRDKREEVAQAMFGLTAIYEKQGDADAIIRHLRRYLREYGNSAVDREIIARVKIGMLLWEQSCPVKGVDGACVRITRERSIVQRRTGRQKRAQLPTQCGPESKINLTVVARDARRVRDAQQEFRQAIRLFGKGAAVGRVGGETDQEKAVRAAHMIRYYAAARFYLNEQDYEAFLGITFPQNLDFDPKNKRRAEQSMKQFMSWFNRKQELGAKASQEYRSIVDITGGGAHYAIAGAARIGQISQNFSDALFTAEIPRDVRTGQFAEDKVDAYCDELTTRAGPLEELSIAAFGFCLETSTKLNWFNEWSRLCERELGQIRPQDFPTAAELYANPYNVAAIIDNEGPILDLTTGNRP